MYGSKIPWIVGEFPTLDEVKESQTLGAKIPTFIIYNWIMISGFSLFYRFFFVIRLLGVLSQQSVGFSQSHCRLYTSKFFWLVESGDLHNEIMKFMVCQEHSFGVLLQEYSLNVRKYILLSTFSKLGSDLSEVSNCTCMGTLRLILVCGPLKILIQIQGWNLKHVN